MRSKATKEENLANKYANSIYPDFSEYYEWKKIKDAYLAGFNGHALLIMPVRNEEITLDEFHEAIIENGNYSEYECQTYSKDTVKRVQNLLTDLKKLGYKIVKE